MLYREIAAAHEPQSGILRRSRDSVVTPKIYYKRYFAISASDSIGPRIEPIRATI
jgi:hypothetical protein